MQPRQRASSVASCASSLLEIKAPLLSGVAAAPLFAGLDFGQHSCSKWREEEGGPRKGHEVPILSGDDRRRLVPQAVVQVLTALLDSEEHSHRWAELRTLRTRLCKLYGMRDPAAPANASEVAQDVAEEDGDAVQE